VPSRRPLPIRIRSTRAVLAAVPALGIAGATVDAQEASVVTVLEPVTVTATKTARPAFTTPGSVSVIRRDDIEERQPAGVGELIRALPNVETIDGPRRIGQAPNIRGFTDDRIVVTVDGARQNFQSGHKGRFFIEPELLKQVEIHRGGNSALYGSGALGGVVAFTTVDPADLLKPGQTMGAEAKVGYQSGYREMLGSLTGYGRNAWGGTGRGVDALANVTYRRGDDLRVGGGGTLDNSASDLVSGLAKVGFDLGPGHRATVSGTYFLDNGDYPSNPGAAESRENPLVDRRTEQRNYQLGYRWTHPTEPLVDIAAVAYHNETDIRERLASGGRDDRTEFATTGFDVRNTSRLAFGESVRTAVTYGIEYYRDDQTGRRNGGERPQFPDATSDVLGLYLQTDITLFDRLSVVPGVRYDHYRQARESGESPEVSEGEVSPRLAIGYQPLDWLYVYGSYAEAFRAPNLTDLYVTGQHFFGNAFVPNPNLRPEKAKTYEAGVRARFRDVVQPNDRISAEFVYFHSDVRDFIDLLVTRTTTTAVNITDAELKGFEASLRYDGPWYFATVAYGQTRGTNATTGEGLISVPADKWSLGGGLRFPEWGLSLGGRVLIADGQKRVPEGTPTSKSYATLDLYGSFQPPEGRFSNLRVDFGVDNVFDEEYRPFLFSLPAVGRNFKVALSYRF